MGQAHIQKALDEKIYRSNMIEERIREMVENGSILIDTTGTAAAQVNGRRAGRRCWPPYQLEIGGLLREGENAIEIEVTNSMGGLLRTCGWQAFSGRTTGEAPSSLLGPVRIIETG